MLEILKIHVNVEFGLRKWPPKNGPKHEFSKITTSEDIGSILYLFIELSVSWLRRIGEIVTRIKTKNKNV